MKFEIHGEEFIVEQLLEKSPDDPEVNRLIGLLKKNDTNYLAHEPIDEDVRTTNDKWSCHIAEDTGITFEFTNDQLCYISIRTDSDGLEHFNNPPDSVVCALVGFGDEFEYACGSVEILSNEDLIPNRYSPILMTLLDYLDSFYKRD